MRGGRKDPGRPLSRNQERRCVAERAGRWLGPFPLVGLASSRHARETYPPKGETFPFLPLWPRASDEQDSGDPVVLTILASVRDQRSGRWASPRMPVGLLLRNHADFFSGFAPTFIGHDTVNLGVDRIIPPETHIGSGVDFCATLTDEDAPGRDPLAREPFYTEALSGAVPTVS